MGYNFDEIIDRKNTYSIKYDAERRGKPADVLPLWVADMDFRAPQCVQDALAARCQHGVFGYSEVDDAYVATLQSWFSRRFQWNIKKEWLITTPGVVTAIHIAIRALTEEGDSVIIQEPVYYPFSSAIRQTGRELIINQLKYENGRYEIDFVDFEEKLIQHAVKLFVLCSPHNPVGRVWTCEELSHLGDICVKHGVLVIADEIHQDFVYAGYQHTVFANISSTFEEISITCTAPSKTFNLAGLQLSNIFIPNVRIRKQFLKEYHKCGLSQPGVMGIIACEAAYAGGEVWLLALQQYLVENLAYLRAFLQKRIPQIQLVEPQGTYLVWLDFSELGISGKALDEWVIHKAGLWLDDGPMFGEGGEGFQRVNIACPRRVIEEALTRLEKAVAMLPVTS